MISALSLASLFKIEAREYQSLSLDAGDTWLLTVLVFGICGGIVLASLYTLYQKSVPGSLVRALLAAQAHTPEAAKSMAELNLRPACLILLELRHNPVLGKLVLTEGQGSEARYYIPEASKYRANARFGEKGNALLQLILTVLLSLLLAILLFKLIPLVLSMVDAIL